jgi:hypothetical protein
MSDLSETPDRDEPDGVKRRKFFTQVALAGSQELRSHLPLNETHYLRLTLEAQADARTYFMYSVLDSVYQAGVAMMRWEDLVPDDQNEATKGGAIEERLINEALANEGAMWTRRLIEALTTLICFSATNEEAYYRHWLFLDQLESFNYKRKDQKDYFACESKSLSNWIDKTTAKVREIEQAIDFNRAWYLKAKRALPTTPPPSLLHGFAGILRIAIPLASPREKVALGMSYQHFSRVSGDIHFTVGEKWYERTESGLAGHFSHCSILVQAILMRVIELASLKPTGLCAQMIRVYGNNHVLDEGSRHMTGGRAKVGDFAVVGQGLARVLRVNTSAYGYESYTVRFLADPPALDVVEDDVLPFRFRRLFAAEKIKQSVIELLQQHSKAPISEEERRRNVEESIEDSVKEAWNLGLRASLFGKTRNP